jgi:formylglycine-generating enzyme required for sulfatase activity
MAGNVYEWVYDWLGNYSDKTLTDPTGPQEGREKIGRSSSWASHQDRSRSASRNRVAPEKRMDHTGFRCARGPDVP